MNRVLSTFGKSNVQTNLGIPNLSNDETELERSQAKSKPFGTVEPRSNSKFPLLVSVKSSPISIHEGSIYRASKPIQS